MAAWNSTRWVDRSPQIGSASIGADSSSGNAGSPGGAFWPGPVGDACGSPAKRARDKAAAGRAMVSTVAVLCSPSAMPSLIAWTSALLQSVSPLPPSSETALMKREPVMAKTGVVPARAGMKSLGGVEPKHVAVQVSENDFVWAQPASRAAPSAAMAVVRARSRCFGVFMASGSDQPRVLAVIRPPQGRSGRHVDEVVLLGEEAGEADQSRKQEGQQPGQGLQPAECLGSGGMLICHAGLLRRFAMRPWWGGGACGWLTADLQVDDRCGRKRRRGHDRVVPVMAPGGGWARQGVWWVWQKRL